MTEITDADVERVARALGSAMTDESYMTEKWVSPAYRAHYCTLARAAIAAYLAGAPEPEDTRNAALEALENVRSL